MTPELIRAVASSRSILFVPGDRPDRFTKALASGADGIVIDLEDSVGPDSKDEARENVRQWRAAGGLGLVRVNDPTSPWHDDDLVALNDSPSVVMLPKTVCADQVASTLSRLPPGSVILPILESATGILESKSICSANGVIRAAFGNADLALELGVDHCDRAALSYARAAVVMASAAAGIAPPLDGVTTAIDDDQLLRDDVRHASELGFTGRLCIHPRQVRIVNDGFTPSEQAVREARDILASADSSAVAVVEGRMIDRPIVERARRLLARYEMRRADDATDSNGLRP